MGGIEVLSELFAGVSEFQERVDVGRAWDRPAPKEFAAKHAAAATAPAPVPAPGGVVPRKRKAASPPGGAAAERRVQPRRSSSD